VLERVEGRYAEIRQVSGPHDWTDFAFCKFVRLRSVAPFRISDGQLNQSTTLFLGNLTRASRPTTRKPTLGDSGAFVGWVS
jgi:hypothetical protein